MKIFTVRLLSAILLALALSGAAMAQDQDENRCSNAAAAGKWGFTTAGTVFLPSGTVVPVVVVGRFTLDAAGNLEGTQTRSLNYLPVNRETISGTIQVNSDCTATATISVFQSGVFNRKATLDLVFVQNLRGVRGVFTSAINNSGLTIGTVLTFDGNKQLTGD